MTGTRLTPTKAALLAAVLVAWACAPAASGEPVRSGEPEVARLVRVVADPDSDWDARQSAEQELSKLPPRVVLPVLVTRMPDQPLGVFYPPADSAAADKDAPPAWQAFYAARRVWNAQAGVDRPAAELAELLPDLLRAAATAEARAAIAARLTTAWSNRAEEPLARLLRDSGEPPTVRARAAEALLVHRPAQYRREVGGLADAAPWSSPLKQALFLALTAPTARADGIRAPKAEPFPTLLGFQLMERSAREKDIDSAYAYSRRLETYLDQHFRPEPARAAYGPDPDSDARYQRETLDHARAWWRDHGAAVEREVAKSKPGPA